jgi:hypothetical protein
MLSFYKTISWFENTLRIGSYTFANFKYYSWEDYLETSEFLEDYDSTQHLKKQISERILKIIKDDRVVSKIDKLNKLFNYENYYLNNFYLISSLSLKKKNNFNTYFLVSDDGLSYYFDSFNNNTKIGNVLNNSVKGAYNFSDFSNSSQIHDYGEFFGNSKSYQELINSLNYQYYSNNYRISKFNTSFINKIHSNTATLLKQNYLTKNKIQNYYNLNYTNKYKESLDLDNYIRFYLNIINLNKNIKYVDSYIGNEKIKTDFNDNFNKNFGEINNYYGYYINNNNFFNFPDLPINESFDNYCYIENISDLVNSDDLTNLILKNNLSSNPEYFESYQLNESLFDERISFLLKNIIENPNPKLTEYDNKLTINDYFNNISLVTKDLVAKKKYKNKIFGNDSVFKNNLKNDQIQSFIGSF